MDIEQNHARGGTPLSAKYMKPPSLGINQNKIDEAQTQITKRTDEESSLPACFDMNTPVKWDSFPNQGRGGSQTPATISNLRHILDSYGIEIRYNVVTKKVSTKIPGYSGSPDNAEESAISYIMSLAVLNNMATGLVPSFLSVIANENLVNPVADWITSRNWDGTDRLQEFYETLQVTDNYDIQLKQILMYKWMLSAVAAMLKPSGFKARGVLTLQGPQSIGKTSWINALVPDQVLRESVVKLDHHLDPSNKDSVTTAICHWIVEIGELDSSFKKDIARLKGTLTADRDKIRRPYGRTDSEYARRTVFCATVNESNFLVDPTGNTRFWCIPVIKVNYDHGIDMQQLFAQLALDFQNGNSWWLSQDEEKLLESFNNEHRAISVIRESILDIVDLDNSTPELSPAVTPTELLRDIGFRNPTNSQCKEAAQILRELFGGHKRINGSNKWRVPMKVPFDTLALISAKSSQPISGSKLF